jgi:hypothetical protein
MPITDTVFLQDKLWDLDKSWENNLVFYGVKEEAGNREETLSMCEGKVREVIKLKLGISRSIYLLFHLCCFLLKTFLCWGGGGGGGGVF